MTRHRLVNLTAGFAFLGMTIGCNQIGGTEERRLVDLNDGPVALRARVAQEYATDEQLARLRVKAKSQFPMLTDADLATLHLGWQRAVLGDGEHVMLEVTFMPTNEGIDAAAVANYVAQQVLQDLRAQLTTNTPSAE